MGGNYPLAPSRRRLTALNACGVLVALALAVPAHAALQLHTDADGVSAAERQASDALLEDVRARLPPQLIQQLDREVRVRWRDDLPPQIHGRTRGDRIALKRALLRDWMAQPGDEAAGHAARAALIHELAHVFDRSPQGGLSRDPRLLDIAGWQRRPWGGRGHDNAFRDRSPDTYELASPREYVAVNLEHFLLDADYACRRPLQQAWFAAYFEWMPAQADCVPGQVFVQAGSDADPPLLQLDPERVYAVDYLLAEGNDQAMSRWGHSMLRLVVCAPGRERGPDCRLDLQHHRVLSFRAFVDDVQISSWRGLTGSYPSRMFVLPLGQVIDEYTKVELRGLQSIPLALSRQDIDGLLQRAAQLHWSYDGRYYFVSNNCAVETWKLLREGAPSLAQARFARITPTGLLARLARLGVAEPGVLDDATQAERQGYYFPSAGSQYQQLYDVARRGDTQAPAKVEDWLALPAATRARAIERVDLRGLAALLVLESAAQRRLQARARDVLKRELLAADASPDTLSALADYLQASNALSRPAAWPVGGYGLPQAGERTRLRALGEQQARTIRTRESELRTAALAGLPASLRTELDATAANLERLGTLLREAPATSASG